MAGHGGRKIKIAARSAVLESLCAIRPGCVLSQLSNFASNRNAALISCPQRALDLRYHPKRHPDRGGGAVRDRNPPKKPKRSPRAGGAENANDGKAPARPQDGTDQHPRCAPRPKPPRDRTGRTRDVEFIEGIDKCRGGDPDGLFASSLATSTTARARPESWASGRASTVPSPASLSARRNPVVALSPRTERLAHHLLDHAGR